MLVNWLRLPLPVLALAVAVEAVRYPRQIFTNSSSTLSTSSASDRAYTLSSNERFTAANSASSVATISLSSPVDNATTTSSIPASPALAAGTARITNSANVTRDGNATTTPRPEGSCCYIRPNAVGVNSWWSSSMELPIAKVITTWLQYNNTRIPANSTTITVLNATNPVGWYSWTITTVSTVWPLTTVTMPTTTMTLANGGPTFVYDYVTNSSRLSGVPNTLLPSQAQMYASSQVLAATTMAYDLQQMTFTSPTPWLWYSQIYIGISAQCNNTKPGLPATEKAIMPTSTVVQSIPNDDGSDFTFSRYMEDRGMIREGDGSNLYQFTLPEDLPSLLAGIPEVAATWPNIGECTNMIGQGEPTVHIPVSQLTVLSDVTITMRNTITSNNDQPTTTVGSEPSSASAVPVVTPDQPTATSIDSSPTNSPEASNTAVSPELPQQTNNVPGPTSNAGEIPAASPTGIDGLISAIGDAAQGTSEAAVTTPTTGVLIGNVIASVIGLVPAQTTAGAAQSAASPVPVVVGSSVVTADNSGNFEIGGQTLQPGSVITVDGDTVSLDSSGTVVVINGATTPVAVAAPEVTIDGSTLTADSAGAFVVGSQTLQPGSTVNIDGTIISLAPSGTALVIDGSTTPIAAPAPVVTLPGATLAANADGSFELAGPILQAGSAITSGRTTLSLVSDASAIVVNGQTTPITAAVFPSALYAFDASATAASITVGGSIITAHAEGAYAIDSQTLAAGSAITISGTTYSLASDGNELLINGQATPIDVPVAAMTSFSAAAGLITAVSSTLGFTALGSDAVVIGTQTLSSGGEYGNVVIDGNTLSLLNPSQVVIVSGSRTSTMILNPTTTVVVTRWRNLGTSMSGSGAGETASVTRTNSGTRWIPKLDLLAMSSALSSILALILI